MEKKTRAEPDGRRASFARRSVNGRCRATNSNRARERNVVARKKPHNVHAKRSVGRLRSSRGRDEQYKITTFRTTRATRVCCYLPTISRACAADKTTIIIIIALFFYFPSAFTTAATPPTHHSGPTVEPTPCNCVRATSCGRRTSPRVEGESRAMRFPPRKRKTPNRVNVCVYLLDNNLSSLDMSVHGRGGAAKKSAEKPTKTTVRRNHG